MGTFDQAALEEAAARLREAAERARAAEAARRQDAQSSHDVEAKPVSKAPLRETTSIPTYHRFSDADRAANEETRRASGLPPSRSRTSPPEIRIFRPELGERYPVDQQPARPAPGQAKRPKKRWWQR